MGDERRLLTTPPPHPGKFCRQNDKTQRISLWKKREGLPAQRFWLILLNLYGFSDSITTVLIWKDVIRARKCGKYPRIRFFSTSSQLENAFRPLRPANVRSEKIVVIIPFLYLQMSIVLIVTVRIQANSNFRIWTNVLNLIDSSFCLNPYHSN